MIGADGQAIGEVAAVFLESEAWAVEAIQVKLRNAIADRFGAARTIFSAGTVDIPVRLVQSVGDAVVLAVPVEALRQLLPSPAVSAHAADA